jgi:riboflavin synthase
MFTGIIQEIGRIHTINKDEFQFSASKDFLQAIVKGDSIAVNGVCLTVICIQASFFGANISDETLRCTTFEDLRVGSNVNLEKSLRFNQGVDGHLVSGHVDATTVLMQKNKEGESVRFKISTPDNLVKYIAKKGSVCLNGVSLTVNIVTDKQFEINIVPHTLSETTLSELMPGDKINLEVDIIARHLEQLLSHHIKEH